MTLLNRLWTWSGPPRLQEVFAEKPLALSDLGARGVSGSSIDLQLRNLWKTMTLWFATVNVRQASLCHDYRVVLVAKNEYGLWPPGRGRHAPPFLPARETVPRGLEYVRGLLEPSANECIGTAGRCRRHRGQGCEVVETVVDEGRKRGFVDRAAATPGIDADIDHAAALAPTFVDVAVEQPLALIDRAAASTYLSRSWLSPR